MLHNASGKVGISLGIAWYEPADNSTESKQAADRAFEVYAYIYMYWQIKSDMKMG